LEREERVRAERDVPAEEHIDLEELKEGAPGVGFTAMSPALPIRLVMRKVAGAYETFVQDVSTGESQKLASISEEEIKAAVASTPGPKPLGWVKVYGHYHTGGQCPSGRCHRCGGRTTYLCRRVFLWWFQCLDSP